MRLTNLQQLAKGINSAADGAKRSHALAEIDRAKWRLWNGLTERGIIGLVHLGQWAQAPCFDHIPFLEETSAHAFGDNSLSGTERRLHARLR
jgi:hypothetical protein